eukprot:CAMPEP_0178381890 /NCGR_PEP_ID=MMETSP0689_2-20121128/6217_1 /TAXON_ID=160604 /ORGANISM="Amphidinium massartii, Strain CS-259" /LENGTH=240 /DNA_ID=CAMNT_0020002089 /DNA_START=38 /DNA_END=757 /DNA_ORIENTATION=+
MALEALAQLASRAAASAGGQHLPGANAVLEKVAAETNLKLDRLRQLHQDVIDIPRSSPAGSTTSRQVLPVRGVHRPIRNDTRDSEAQRLNELVRDIQHHDLHEHVNRVHNHARQKHLDREIKAMKEERALLPLEVPLSNAQQTSDDSRGRQEPLSSRHPHPGPSTRRLPPQSSTVPHGMFKSRGSGKPVGLPQLPVEERKTAFLSIEAQVLDGLNGQQQQVQRPGFGPPTAGLHGQALKQ